ncbi:MAG: transglutaminase-like domain-containing protein [Candidatus Micrarchaeia archaeon]
MKGKALLLLAVLLQVSFALETRLVEQMNLTVIQSGSIRAVGGELKYLIMNLSVPAQTSYQTVISDKPVTQLPDGNSIVTIESTKPTNPFRYTVTSSVSVKARKTTALPASYQVNYSLMQLTKPTARVQSDDPEIKEMARLITANSSDDFERVAKLALWVNSHLAYDSSLAGSLKDAKWILKNRRGVCAEYSTLFVAFARSLGIPARFVSGMAYDEDKGEWIGHAWAEVYLGEWVPVDATWNPPEVGYLDASHLEISKYLDDETFDNVYTLTSQNARIEWLKPDSSKGTEVRVVSFKEGKRSSNYQLEAVAKTIGFGVKTVVFAVISSDDYRVVSLNLSPCTGNIIYVDDAEKNIILKPGETKVVSWVVTSNPKLSTNYIYQCPLILNSEYLEPKQVGIEVRADAPSINFNAFLEKSEVVLGENQTTYVDVGVARKYEGRLYLTSDYYVSSQPVTRSGRYSFSFEPKATGINNVYIATTLGGVRELQFKVTGVMGVGVDVRAPEFILLGNATRVYVVLASNQTNRSIRITATAGDERETKQLLLTGNRTVEFMLNITDTKVQNITVEVESADFARQFVKPVTVYRVPEVEITNLAFRSENGLVRTTFRLSGVQDARDISLTIDGQPVSLTQMDSVSLLLTPGEHLAVIEFKDLAGGEYKKSHTVEVPEVSAVETQSNFMEILPAVLYVVLLILLSAGVLAFKKIEKLQ